MNPLTTHPSPSNYPQQGNANSGGRQRQWIKAGLWIAGSLVLLGLLVIATASVILTNSKVHSYLLTAIQEKASESLGVEVRLQNIALHPSNLSVDVYGLVVHGADPYSNPPILQLEHALVGVRIVSVLHRRWYLDQVVVDHPVVRILSDVNGMTNIPGPKSSGNNSNTNLFDFGIRHAVLDRGELYYNDEKAIFAADVHNLDFRSSFSTILEKYSGTLSYQDGHVHSGALNPIPHNLEATFDATRTAFHLNQAKLTSGSSQLVVTASVDYYDSPKVQAHYDAVVDVGEVRNILKNASIPTGLIHAGGTLSYKNDRNRPAIEMLVVDGDADSHELSLRSPDLQMQIGSIAAHYSFSNGNAIVHDFRAHLLGGELTGEANMQNVAGDPHPTVKLTLRGVSLTDLKRLAPPSPATRDVAVGGVLNAEAEATWGKTLDSIQAHTNAALHGTLSRAANSATLPIDGVIHGTYSGSNRVIGLRRSYIRLPESVLTMDGTISNHSSLALDFESKDLHELETVAMIATVPTPGQPMQPLGLAGTAAFKGVVRGSSAAPHLTGQLQASNLQVRGTAWRVLRTDIDVDPSLVSLQNAVLEPATRGRIAFSAGTELNKWRFSDTSPIRVDLTASQINLADLAKLAGVQAPITGNLTAHVKMQGTELSPAGQGDITILQAKVQDETIQSAKLKFSSSGDDVHSNLIVRLAAGTIEGVATVRPREQTYQAQLTANGIKLEQLETLKARNVDATGSLSLKASGQGTFKDPQVNATLQIPRLDIQKQTLTDLILQVNVVNHVANATLNSGAMNTSVQAKARVNLTGDYFADATLDTQPIPLPPLVAIYAPAQAADLSGQTELHATLRGPLQDRSRLEAHVTIPILKMAYSNTLQLAAVSPIHADFSNNVLTVQHSIIKGTGTDLEFQGTVPTVGNAPISILLRGTVDLQIAQLLSPDVRSSGRLRFNIDSYGARTDPNVEGQVEVVDASFADGDLPVGLQHGNGMLTLTKDRLNITKFEGKVGGGTLTAQGGVAYRPVLQFNMGLAARGIRLLYPQGMREGIDADLALSGTPEDALLGGQVRLTDLSFTPDFDLARFAGQFSGGATPPPAQGFTQNLRLNVGVTSSSGINLVSRTLSVGGTANLQVRGTAAQPVILGRINLTGGDLIANGDRFLLDRGTIQFVNPSETQPVVNVALDTTIQEYNIHLRFSGPVDQLHTNYASDPALPAADIINLLAFGKTNEAGVADPATPGNQAAESLVASQVSSQITSRVSKIAGISQLSIDPVLGGGSANPGARITIQQRVTGNLYVTFSSDVTSTQNQVITGQYRLSPRVSVSATRDQNGGFALDTRIKKSW